MYISRQHIKLQRYQEQSVLCKTHCLTLTRKYSWLVMLYQTAPQNSLYKVVVPFFSIVSLTFANGKMCARYSNGRCGVAMCNRKSIPRNTTQEDRKPVSSHIKTMSKEIQFIKTSFPEYFQEGDVEEHNF